MEQFKLIITKFLAAGFILAAGTLLPANLLQAATITVDPKVSTLSQALQDAVPGDVLSLLPGIHAGPIKIDKSISITGPYDAVIQGNGKGNTITVNASDVTISGITVTGSGLLLETQDSGIFVSKPATNVKIINNSILDNLIGVYMWGARDSLVKNNRIIGRMDMRINERGNGVQLWNAPGTIVDNNDISHGRDGIFVTTSKKNIFKNNYLHNVRFGVHYMYTDKSQVTGNISKGNHIGFAIMFSTKITVANNISENDRDRGILFNYANKVLVENNKVTGGPKKCVFIYNSNKNQFLRNLFSNCLIGIHFTGGSAQNEMIENAFIDNRTQVKYVGTRWLDWSKNGRGNYWSDHAAFDLDGDGVADAAYRPNDLTDQILWRYPSAKLLTNSPAVQLLQWAQSAFPALHPGGIIDTAPLMRPAKSLKVEHGS